MRKVELYERIRRDHAQFGWGIRRLAREHRCHRRDVRQALESAVPPRRRSPARERPVLGPWLGTIDSILAADRKAPRKQRHTAHRIWVRLTTEFGASVAEATVREYVRERRRDLYGVVEAMVPQIHMAGVEAEVDLSQALVKFHAGEQKVDFFQMRPCHSGAPFHWPLRSLSQQAFLEAHVAAFEHFGGVFEVVRYDNLVQAVRKVLRGRNRLESDRFLLLRSHYRFSAVFCQPGLRGAHEKGGVEGEVGYFRRNHLVPIPEVGDWGHLIDHCQFAARDELNRHLDGRVQSVGEAWALERLKLRPLPAERFDARLHYIARVDPKARITVLRNRYSVPVRWCGLAVDVTVSSLDVIAYRDGREIGRHERLYGIGGDRLKLDHYLEVLRYKPRALAGSLALHQGVADGSFPTSYRDFHARLVERLGESEGARQMVDVLFLHREYGPVIVITAVEQALAAGAYDYAAVALLARQRAEPPRPTTAAPQLHVLRAPAVPLPDCIQYDQLLAHEPTDEE